MSCGSQSPPTAYSDLPLLLPLLNIKPSIVDVPLATGAFPLLAVDRPLLMVDFMPLTVYLQPLMVNLPPPIVDLSLLTAHPQPLTADPVYSKPIPSYWLSTSSHTQP